MMTNPQTKNELSKEFKDIKYILTSSMRTKLLLAVYEIPMNLDELRVEIDRVDDQLFKLIEQRMDIAAEIARQTVAMGSRRGPQPRPLTLSTTGEAQGQAS